MAHVGIERFGSGDGEHDGAEHRKARSGLRREGQGIAGIESQKHVRAWARFITPSSADDHEPDHHDRAEIARRPAPVPKCWMAKSAIRMTSGDGDHRGGEVRVDQRQALDGRETEIAGVIMPSP